VIGHGDGGHFKRRGLPHQSIDAIGSIQEAVLSVNVEVYELRAGHAVLCYQRLGILSGHADEVNLMTDARSGTEPSRV
jgi:hypothetical protein